MFPTGYGRWGLCKGATRGRSVETLLDTSESDRGKGDTATASSSPSLCCPEWPALLCRTAEGGGKEAVSGATVEDRDRDGAGTLASDGRPPRGAKYHPTDPRPFSLARPGCWGKTVLSSLSDMPTDVTSHSSPQSTDSVTHPRGALRADRDGSGRAAAKVRPGPQTHPRDSGLRHSLPGSHSPSQSHFQGHRSGAVPPL